MPGAACAAACTFPGTRTTLVARKVLEIEGCDRYRAPIINEGGAIHVDGAGHGAGHRTMPAQSESQSGAVDATRSSGTCEAYLGVQAVIWLGEGVFDDETDGHIDNLACFVKPGRRGAALDRRQARSAVRHLAATRSSG